MCTGKGQRGAMTPPVSCRTPRNTICVMRVKLMHQQTISGQHHLVLFKNIYGELRATQRSQLPSGIHWKYCTNICCPTIEDYSGSYSSQTPIALLLTQNINVATWSYVVPVTRQLFPQQTQDVLELHRELNKVKHVNHREMMCIHK